MNESGTEGNGRRFDSSLQDYISINGAQSAWELLLDEEHCRHITTSCAELDHILGGGVACKEVTEVGGVPGIGKTQLGIQLAVNVQIPVVCGGIGGKAVYVDTEGSFMVERALQISEGCIEDIPKNEVSLHPKDILEGIFYFRIYNYIQQVAVINYLDEFISEHPDVKIVIIDSIAFHFRQETDDMAHRARVLSGMASKLMKLSNKFGLAVVTMNQVTTKYSKGSFNLALALGDTWSHGCTNRVILYWEEDERRGFLDKSPSLPPASAPFSVNSKGIRSCTSTSFSSFKRLKTSSS